ncbi:fungal-specific transcription factor [Diaporthe sp. PMI_573]|nr:fungal-specific transcription factor [Diaporthaceae sp. PMI_573]
MDDHMEQDSPPENTPSYNPHYSGVNAVSITQTTSDSTASASKPSAGTPATAHTTQTADTSSSAGTPIAPTATSKRRRGLGMVTRNACTECRKKRAKCDGQQPCGRCSAHEDIKCHYKVPVRQSKENLRSEIEHLRRQQASSESVISALSHNAQWEEVLRRLRSGQSVDVIEDWLSSQLSSGPGVIPTFGHPSGTGTNLISLPNFAGAGAASYIPGIGRATSSATVRLTSTVPPLSSRKDVDPSIQWNQYSEASQAHFHRSNSQSDTRSWGLSGPPQTRVEACVADNLSKLQPSEGTYRGLDFVGLLTPEVPPLSGVCTTWSEISSDSTLVRHILALYFCWEYPIFASLSKEHFLKDFHFGRPRYCSPILVNALLALGCRFSPQPDAGTNPDETYSLGDHFFKESLHLYFMEDDHHSLTTIQALGIISIREASCGRDSESRYYAGQSFRLAVEMGLDRVSNDLGDGDEFAVQTATFWGAFALDHAWSLVMGSLPQCSRLPYLPSKPTIMPDTEASMWSPYTGDGRPLEESFEQPSNVGSVYKCFCELNELVHESLYTLHTPGQPLRGANVLYVYMRFTNWYDAIPAALRLGQNSTPAVLFAHMYYHFATLLLFRPLIKLRIKKSKFLPRDVCASAANAIQALTKSYSHLYTLQRTPSFVPYFILASSIVHLAIATTGTPSQSEGQAGATGRVPTQKSPADHPPAGSGSPQLDPRVTRSINQGIASLKDMASCHDFAEQALNILRYLAKKWNIEVDLDVTQSVKRDKEKAHNAGGKATRTSGFKRIKDHDYGTWPATNRINFFAPNVNENDFFSSWGDLVAFPTAPAPASPPVVRSGDSIEDPLFWPFPIQGRPIMPMGDALAEAGFELL